MKSGANSSLGIAFAVGAASAALDVLTNTTGGSEVDTVMITRAGYQTARRKLRVEATSTRSDAILQVFVTSSDQLIGPL